MEAKTFGVAAVLSVTTGKLLTKRRSTNDNGIGELHGIPQWAVVEYAREMANLQAVWEPIFGEETTELLRLISEVARARSSSGCLPLLSNVDAVAGDVMSRFTASGSVDVLAWLNRELSDCSASNALQSQQKKTMRQVILYTSTGEFIGGSSVPAFNEPPDVLFWGGRVFIYQSTDDEFVDWYRECFTYVLMRVD